MQKKFRALFVLVAVLVVSSACEWYRGNSPTSPSPKVLDMTKPFDVVDASSTPSDGATLRLGSFWEIRYTVWCANDSSWWSFYFVRDDGATSTNNGEGGSNCGGRQRGGTNGILNEGNVLYKFGRGHKVIIRFAMAPDQAALQNGSNLTVSDKEIVAWFIAED